MALESANFIPQLVDTNPLGVDAVLEGDNHVRMLKTVLQNQFPNIPSGSVINALEAPNEPADTLTEPTNVMLWSPKAIADFVKEHFGGWGLTVAESTSMRIKNAAQGVIARNTPTKIMWDATPDWDTASAWDALNNQYVLPTAGIWRVNCQFFIQWATTLYEESYLRLDILVDDTVRATAMGFKGGPGNVVAPTVAIDRLFNAGATSTISARFTYDSSALEQIYANNLESTFEIQRIGDTPA